MPFFSQASTSSGSIAREASEIEVSPAQNFSKPPPVPDVPTVTLTPGLADSNCSATASVSGATVLLARVGGPQRRIDHVDAEDHPGSPPIGRVVDLPSPERSRVAVVEQPQLVAFGDRVLHRALGLKPVERLGKEREDVELQ